MIKYFCDRCKEDCSDEFKANRVSYITLKKFSPYYCDEEGAENTRMLCRQCTSLLEHFLETP